jgi:hypothetical protein
MPCRHINYRGESKVELADSERDRRLCVGYLLKDTAISVVIHRKCHKRERCLLSLQEIL